jgi:hypothetical protein
MKTPRVIFPLLVIIGATGCVTSLNEVREYGKESAKLSAYTELTTRFRDTYEREHPYLFGAADDSAQVNDKKRKAVYRDLIRIHQTVARYMETLAKLAGEETFDLSKDIDALAGGIKANTEMGIDSKQVEAVSNIAKVITRWVTSTAQFTAVQAMVREGDAPLQTTLEGMITLVRYYRNTNENERKVVLGIFESEIPFADTAKDKLLVALARAHMQQKTLEYTTVQPKYDEAEKGIKSVAEGHKELVKNADKLSSSEVKALIDKCAKDIKAVRKDLESVSE